MTQTSRIRVGPDICAKRKGKVVFFVIKIGQTLLQKQIIPDSLISRLHQVQFRLGSPLLHYRSSWNVRPLTGCGPFYILWAPFKQDDLLSCFAGFCHLPAPPARCSIFFDKIQAVFPYCSKLWVLIFSYRLVLSYQLDWTRFENRVLYPHRHKYSLGDIIVSPARFLGALIHQFSEVSSSAALFALCPQTFYTKGTTKLPNCVHTSSHSFQLCD